MSGVATAAAVAIRDQIVAILRDSERPLSTPEIASRALPWIEIQWWHRGCRGQCRTISGYRVVACHLDTAGAHGTRHTVKVPAASSGVYAHLRRLAAVGVVERVDVADLDTAARLELVIAEAQRGNRRPVFWRYADDQSDEAFNALLTAWQDA